MKQEMLQMLKCVVKNEKKLKLLLAFLVKSIKKKIGDQIRGKRRLNLGHVVAGILYYLKTGCTWRYLPPLFGNYKTIAAWFIRLVKMNIFSSSWDMILHHAAKSGLLKLKRLLVDGSLTCIFTNMSISKFNPRNRNKRSINRQTITDSRGAPLGYMLAQGTSHDTQFLIPLLDGLKSKMKLPKNFVIHADKGYDSLSNRWGVSVRDGITSIPVRNRGYEVEYPRHKDIYRPRVELSIAWINRFKCTVNITLKTFESLNQAYAFVFTSILSRFINYKHMKTLIASI